MKQTIRKHGKKLRRCLWAMVILFSSFLLSPPRLADAALGSIVLTADTTDNTVDNDIQITFTPNPDFEAAITGVSYAGEALANNQYTVASGILTLHPSEPGNDIIRKGTITSHVIVYATGYADSVAASQTILSGAMTHLEITIQPVPGAASGDPFATQPVVAFKDQYGNNCGMGTYASATITASANNGSGVFNLGGTTTKEASNGSVIFTDLTCIRTSAGDGSIAFTGGGITIYSEGFTIPPNAPKVLTADTTSNSVDNDLEITFTADSAFEAAITGVSYNGTVLNANQYSISSGKLTLRPSVSGNTYLRTPGTGNVVIAATGYGNSTVPQIILAGAVYNLEVTTQPVPGAVNGDAFGTQPVVKLKDQYGNYCTTGISQTANVVATAKSESGSFSIGGAMTKAAVNGTVTFTDLTCTLTTVGTGKVTFTSGIRTVDSSSFTIPQNMAKTLTADITDNSVDHDLEITFAANLAFEAAITGVSYNGNVLTSSQYSITSGKVTLKPGVGINTYLRTPGTGNVVIMAYGYEDSTVSQTITHGALRYLTISQNITSPATKGGQFGTQPIINLVDQYGNICTSDNSTLVNVTKKDTGSWTLTGTLSVTANAGRAVFTDLGTTNTPIINNAQLAFDASSLSQVVSAAVTLPGEPQAPSNNPSGSTGAVTTGSVTSLVVVNEKEQTTGGGGTVIRVNVNNASEEIKAGVLTPQEQEVVARGENAKVILKVSDISNTVTDQEKKLIKEQLTTDNSSASPSILYIDLSMYKQIGNQEQRKITQTNRKINISIEVPEKLWDKASDGTRAFYVIRIHDNEVTRLDGTYDPKTHLFTFETDRFSTYALTYQDTAVRDNSNQDGKNIITYKDFWHLQLKAKANKTSQTLSFQKIKDVDGYLIYGAKYGEKMKELAQVSADTTSYTIKKRKKGTYYQYQVKAYRIIDGEQVVIATSMMVHSVIEDKSYANPTKVILNASSAKLAIGETKTIKGQLVLPESKKVKKHAVTVRYESTDKTIATVNSKGKITAKAQGSCYVYAYAQNGVYKKIKITVE